ncbi:MAG: hypothetical protein ACYCTV_06640 [Leptospirales bacterium]
MENCSENAGQDLPELKSRKPAHLCLQLLLTFLVLGIVLVNPSYADETNKKKELPPDKIDRVMSLLPVPSDFSNIRNLFVHYDLMVKDVMISHVSSQTPVTIRIDFFLPLPPHCHPTRQERLQYYLQQAIWTKGENSDSFTPLNQWARHIDRNETDWLTGTPCYP